MAPGGCGAAGIVAVVFNREDNKTYEATVDLTGDAVVSFEHVPDVTPNAAGAVRRQPGRGPHAARVQGLRRESGAAGRQSRTPRVVSRYTSTVPAVVTPASRSPCGENARAWK